MKNSIKTLIVVLLLTNTVTGIFLIYNTNKANYYISKYDSLSYASEQNHKKLVQSKGNTESDDIVIKNTPSKEKLTKKEKPKQTSETVYVCMGGSAYAYHRSSGCSGLNKCSADIVPVSLSKAENMGRRPCKKCY